MLDGMSASTPGFEFADRGNGLQTGEMFGSLVQGLPLIAQSDSAFGPLAVHVSTHGVYGVSGLASTTQVCLCKLDSTAHFIFMLTRAIQPPEDTQKCILASKASKHATPLSLRQP